MAVRNLQFVLSGEDKSASRALDRVGKKTDGLSAKLGKVGKAAAFGVAGAAAAVGGGLVAALAAGVRGASDLAESQSKVNTVFGKSSGIITKFSESAARDLGMTRQAALEASGTFGNLFSALGIGVKPAADMSTKLVTLATDLGSFNNVDSEEALLALRSGLLGESEPLRKFGVSLSAARIEAEAFALGLVKPVKDKAKVTAAHNAIEAASLKVAKATKEHGKNSLQARQALDGQVRAEGALEKALKGNKVELTAAQKAQAAYSVILKDTKVAQGDFARTSGGLANQSKILKAQLSDTATSIGQKLLPVLTKVATYVNDEVVPKFNKLVAEFEKGEGAGGKIRDGLEELGQAARDATPHIKDVWEKTKTVVDFVIEHKDAFLAITQGVIAYTVAMKAAAVATTALGVATAGAGAAGAAGAGGKAGAAGKVAKAGRAAGIGGIIGSIGGYVDSKYIDAQGRYKDTVLPDGRISRFDGKTGQFSIIPAPPQKQTPRPGGSSLDRPSTVNPTTPTFRDQRTAALVVPPINVSVISDQRTRVRNGAVPSFVP